MAIDAFLRFTDVGNATAVEGETQDKTFSQKPAAFELQKWSFGASSTSTISSATMGAGSGKAEFDAFTVTKNVDRATPYLFLTSCLGGHYPGVSLMLRKSGGSTTDAGTVYVQWDFKMVFIEKMTWSSGDDAPTEDITFRYGAMRFTYKVQDSKGQLTGKTVESSWSQILNDNEFAVE
jgi:type VI secretion system secreted protein Hcp